MAKPTRWYIIKPIRVSRKSRRRAFYEPGGAEDNPDRRRFLRSRRSDRRPRGRSSCPGPRRFANRCRNLPGLRGCEKMDLTTLQPGSWSRTRRNSPGFLGAAKGHSPRPGSPINRTHEPSGVRSSSMRGGGAAKSNPPPTVQVSRIAKKRPDLRRPGSNRRSGTVEIRGKIRQIEAETYRLINFPIFRPARPAFELTFDQPGAQGS